MARWLFATLAASFAATLPLPAADVDVKIGMYQTMFRDVTPEMVAAIAKPLKGMIEKTIGVTGDAELLPDAAALAKKLNDKKCHIGVFLGYEYAWHRSNYPNIEPFLMAVPHGNKLQACVVVNKNNPAKKISELTNQGVVVPKTTKAHCMVYLNDQRKGLPATTATPIEKRPPVADDALNDLAAENIDAVLMDLAVYESYTKSNPGNASVLKIIGTSENFPFAVLVSEKDSLTPALRERVSKSLCNAHNISYGKPLMLLWGLKAFEEVPVDYNDQLGVILKSFPAPKTVPGTLTGLEKNK